jgi:selenocysteine-specific elongation factor
LTGQLDERDSSGPFRLPVDRVFHRKGIGVVVTGSCYSGSVGVGDPLELLPAGKKVRVRELQSFNDKKEKGNAGERLAIALQGIKLNSLFRGDMLTTPGCFTPSSMVDATLRLGMYAKFELKNRERIRIHHGAKEVLGRVILLDCDTMHSGDSAFVQLRLETSVIPAEGDSLVIRKYSPARVIGGGKILVTHPKKHKRFTEAVLEDLQLIVRGTPEETLLKKIKAAGLQGLRKSDADVQVLQLLLDKENVVDVEDYVFHRDTVQALAKKVFSMCKKFNETHPLRYGIDKEELRQKVQFPLPLPVFTRILDVLSVFQPVFVRKNRVRALHENFTLPESITREIEHLETIIRKSGLLFLSRKEIENQWKGKNPFAEAVQYLRDDGRIVPVGDEGFIHREALTLCWQKLDKLFKATPRLSVADFKNACGLSRKHAIPLLELMDAQKITARVQNERERGPRFPKKEEGKDESGTSQAFELEEN